VHHQRANKRNAIGAPTGELHRHHRAGIARPGPKASPSPLRQAEQKTYSCKLRFGTVNNTCLAAYPTGTGWNGTCRIDLQGGSARQRLGGRLSPTALAPVGIAVAALPARPLGHYLAVLGDLREPLGLFNGPKLLGVAPVLLSKHAFAICRRSISHAEALASPRVLALL
jgi:hypothetical protein